MNNPLLRLLGSVSNSEGLLKETLFRIQEGSTFEVLNNFVFFMVDSSVLSVLDWIVPHPTPIFVVAKMLLIDDIMKSGGKEDLTKDDMCNILKDVLFKEICHINTTNQPFPKIYSDDKKFVLDTSFLSPLTFEESFEIQMIRCYIRLLPDTPFLLYYQENTTNYWMIQSFNGSSSSTTTVIDSSRSFPIPNLSDTLSSLPMNPAKEKIFCTSASVLISSCPLHSIHTQLCKENQDSFAMLFASYPILSTEEATTLPLTVSPDLLVRYSPQPYQTLCLDADLMYEQFDLICNNYTNPAQWRTLDLEFEASSDYTDRIYHQTLMCSSFESVETTMKQMLAAIPTYSSPPSLHSTNNTAIARLVREGIQTAGALLSDPSLNETVLPEWMDQVNHETDFLTKWVEMSLFSLVCQINTFFLKKGWITEDPSPRDSSLPSLKEWIDRKIRVIGIMGLIENTSVLSPADLQSCLQIVEKPVCFTPHACMLLTLPPSIGAKMSEMVRSCEVMCIRRVRDQENAKELELNEFEFEEMNLYMSKELLHDRYRDEREMRSVKECIGRVCKKEVCEKVWRVLEDRNTKMSVKDEYGSVTVSVKCGRIGFSFVC